MNFYLVKKYSLKRKKIRRWYISDDSFIIHLAAALDRRQTTQFVHVIYYLVNKRRISYFCMHRHEERTSWISFLHVIPRNTNWSIASSRFFFLYSWSKSKFHRKINKFSHSFNTHLRNFWLSNSSLMQTFFYYCTYFL